MPSASPDPVAFSQNTPPLISILIPVYNVQAYLSECLDSICAQTFDDFEAICINDGSTDGSRDIIACYMAKDQRFRVIDKPNSGYGASMNQGLDAAKGTYIAILESDDFYAPETLEQLARSAECLEAQVVRANCYLYWSGPPTRQKYNVLVPLTQVGRLVHPQIERDIFFMPPAIWSTLYRSDFLKQNGIRFLETPGASYQDTSFFFKVWANATRAVFLKEAFVHYRQDSVGSSVNSSGKVFCVCDEHAEIDRYLSKRPEVPEWLFAVKARVKYQNYLWNYERLAEEFQLEFLRRMSREMAEEEACGHLDWELLDRWQAYDLKSILDSPECYHQSRLFAKNRTKIGKARHYLKLGGITLLAEVMMNKLFHRN